MGSEVKFPNAWGHQKLFAQTVYKHVSCMFEKCVQIPPNRRLIIMIRASRYPFIDPRHALLAARLKKASLTVREGGARESQQPIVRMGRKLSAASDLAAIRAIFAVKPLLRILRSPPQ